MLEAHRLPRTGLNLVLFDEIEKASDALWNLLLGILDKATLTTGDNKRTDFSRSLVFLTSNLGAREMNSLLDPGMGFGRLIGNGGEERRAEERAKKAAIEAARRKFTPEFMNRLDKVVVFRRLGPPELRQILDMELHMVQQRVLGNGSSKDRAFVMSVAEMPKNVMA